MILRLEVAIEQKGACTLFSNYKISKKYQDTVVGVMLDAATITTTTTTTTSTGI
ncbi:MAG: hypothetical protein M3M89_00440 [Thermoproteota archaeon]|nr:hypothetical protein [Thermoproteota archaeon]